MPAPTIKELCLMLRNGNPEAWDSFLHAFADYTQEAVEATVTSPADSVLLQQGRAQQCQSLLRMFKECQPSSRKPAP